MGPLKTRSLHYCSPPQGGGPQIQSVLRAPKTECARDPHSRVCLGAPEGVNPPLNINK